MGRSLGLSSSLSSSYPPFSSSSASLYRCTRYGSCSARSWSSSASSSSASALGSLLNSLPVRPSPPASLWRSTRSSLHRTKLTSVRLASSGPGFSSEDQIKAAAKEKRYVCLQCVAGSLHPTSSSCTQLRGAPRLHRTIKTWHLATSHGWSRCPSALTAAFLILICYDRGCLVRIANTNLCSTSPLAPSKILQKLPKLSPTKHENIYTLPNFLTFTRLLAAPAVGYFVINSQPIVALSLFFYAGVTDAVDGYLARRYNSQTVVGTVIDPMADKALMTIAVVSLTIQGILPLWVSVIILGRDVALAISAIYFRWISLPPPKTFSRYWDFSLPSAEVHPTEISKINTLLQLLLVGNAMLLPVLPTTLVEAWNLVGVFEGWCGLVATTTIWSGLSYIGNKDAVKILSKEESERRQKNALGEELSKKIQN